MRNRVALSLAGVVVFMLLVGVVSGTILRHFVQATPGILALILLARRFSWANYAALAVFAFWLFIMALIWLFLLGIANIVTGHFTTAEITLTVLVGISSLLGIGAVIRAQPKPDKAMRVAVFVLYAVFQIGAMWISLQPYLARR